MSDEQNGAAGGDGAGNNPGGDNNGGNANESWRNALPENFREAPFIGKAETPEAALQAIQNAASWMGNSLRIPGPDASAEDQSAFAQRAMEKIPGLIKAPNPDDPEQVAAILAKLGAPGSADQYVLPDGVDPAVGANLREWANDAGMTKGQWDIWISKYASNNSDTAATNQAAFDAEQSRLLGEWGMAYDQKAANIYVLMEQLQAPDAVKEAVKSRTLPPDQMRMWDRLVSSVGDEGAPLAAIGKGTDSPKMSPAEAKAQIDEIMKRPEYFDPSSPQQASLMKKVQELFKFVPHQSSNPFAP